MPARPADERVFVLLLRAGKRRRNAAEHAAISHLRVAERD